MLDISCHYILFLTVSQPVLSIYQLTFHNETQMINLTRQYSFLHTQTGPEPVFGLAVGLRALPAEALAKVWPARP